MKQFIEIPTTTLNALKNLLFSEKGTDLSAIINDLSVTKNDDLTAIHVALAYKGIYPDIDKAPRFCRDYNNRYYRYDFVKHSLILGVIKAVRTEISYTNNEKKEISKDEITIGLKQWYEYVTDEQKILDEIVARRK